MNDLTIPFKTGRLAIVSDLHFDGYQRYTLDPIKTWGIEDILWNVDALILACDFTNGPPRKWADVFQYLSAFVPADRIWAFPGNHDYCLGQLEGDAWLAEEAAKAGAHFVQKQVCCMATLVCSAARCGRISA